MATVTVTQNAHATLSGTTIDTVNLTGGGSTGVRVGNRAGTAALWVTVGATLPADPSASADKTYVVPAGLWRQINFDAGNAGYFVKVLGNGNDYTVEII